MSTKPLTMKVVVVGGPKTGHTQVVPPEGLVIGRDGQCDLVLESERISRRHVRLNRLGHGLEVEDLGSTNGVTVNGLRVQGRQQLEPGDRLAVGEFELVVTGWTRPTPGVFGRPLLLLAILLLLIGLVVWWLWLDRRAGPVARHDVRIASVPDGAAVINGGRQLGKTPLTLTGIAAGSYRVLLRRAGYRDLEVVIGVPQGDSTSIHELQPVRATDADVVTVTTLPAGGYVYIDGICRGQAAPAGSRRHQSAPLYVVGLTPDQEHWGYFVLNGDKSKTYTFPVPGSNVNMVLWQPDTVVKTKAGARWLGMVQRQEPNGDLTLAVAEDRLLTVKRDEVSEVQSVTPVPRTDDRDVQVLRGLREELPRLAGDQGGK
jgi:hypothetical protein